MNTVRNRGVDVKINQHTLGLIDKLVEYWSGLSHTNDTHLIPRITQLDISFLTTEERPIVSELRKQLSQEEIRGLPDIIPLRRHQMLHQKSSVRSCALCQERRQQVREEKKQRLRQDLIALLHDTFEEDFLAANARFFEEEPSEELICFAEYERLKAGFVQSWAKRELDTRLDEHQAAAVASTDGNVLVTARAGSGKTRTLVTRAIFLQKQCGVSPKELLLLAFNREAANEMKKRLANALGDDLPHVMTFHALAHALVKPQERLLYDNVDADQLGLSREVRSVIEEHIESQKYNEIIKNLMLSYFREDWERIVDGELLTFKKFIDYRRGLQRPTLNGDHVDSRLEKVVANALFEHNIEYKYKRDFNWSGVNYRPDFTINQSSRVAIECFGPPTEDDYDERTHEKRHHWASMKDRGWTFLEFSHADLVHGEETFVRMLLHKLRESGVKFHSLSEDEIWERIRHRAVDQFTGAMTNFIGRCRMQNLSPGALQSLVESHYVISESERMFLEVDISVYARYLELLSCQGEEDFSGLMWRAVSNVQAGQSAFDRDGGRERGDLSRLRFIMVDEFQDFSPMFFELVDAIRNLNSTARFFCVGDDWQAINAFAGSELRFFQKFDDYFRDAVKREIPTNYRSAIQVVEAGNALMEGKGILTRPHRSEIGTLWIGNLDDFHPYASEDYWHKDGNIIPAVLRLIRHFLEHGQEVVMLSRTNTMPGYFSSDNSLQKFLDQVRSYLKKDDRSRVSISTTHKYKGREHEAVIILDAVVGRYPLIHPNWIFLRIFGENPDKVEEEERRLFYVGLTRAKESLVILTDSTRKSPYIADIRNRFTAQPLQWNSLAPMPSLNSELFEIRVSNAYEVREQLKRQGYTWNPTEGYWHLAMLAKDFSFDDLCGHPWAANCNLYVYSEDGEVIYRHLAR